MGGGGQAPKSGVRSSGLPGDVYPAPQKQSNFAFFFARTLDKDNLRIYIRFISRLNNPTMSRLQKEVNDLAELLRLP